MPGDRARTGREVVKVREVQRRLTRAHNEAPAPERDPAAEHLGVRLAHLERHEPVEVRDAQLDRDARRNTGRALQRPGQHQRERVDRRRRGRITRQHAEPQRAIAERLHLGREVVRAKQRVGRPDQPGRTNDLVGRLRGRRVVMHEPHRPTSVLCASANGTHAPSAATRERHDFLIRRPPGKGTGRALAAPGTRYRPSLAITRNICDPIRPDDEHSPVNLRRADEPGTTCACSPA